MCTSFATAWQRKWRVKKQNNNSIKKNSIGRYNQNWIHSNRRWIKWSLSQYFYCEFYGVGIWCCCLTITICNMHWIRLLLHFVEKRRRKLKWIKFHRIGMHIWIVINKNVIIFQIIAQISSNLIHKHAS